MNVVNEALLIERARRSNPDYPLRRSRLNDVLRIAMLIAWIFIIGLIVLKVLQ